MKFSDKELRDGRKRLKEWLPRARAELKKRKGSLSSAPTSVLGQSLTDRVDKKNLDCIMVYETSPGKWYADIILKGLPRGIPNTLGTPVSLPKADREEAIKEGFIILMTMLAAIEDRKTIKRDQKFHDTRYFHLYGMQFSLPGNAVDEAARLIDSTEGELAYAVEHAIQALDISVLDVFGESDMSSEVFAAASERKRIGLLTAMGVLLTFGIFRYPEKPL